MTRRKAELMAGVCALAIIASVPACVPLPEGGPGYALCNETGNDTGCGDNVAIDVK